jgi:hypothetical protein
MRPPQHPPLPAVAAPARRSPSGPRAVLVALAIAALAWAVAPEAAHAATGDLHVFSGTGPDGTALPAGPWTGLTDGAPGEGGTYGVSFTHAGQGTSITATLAAPANLSFAAAAIRRSYYAPTSSNHSQPQIETSWESRGHPYTGQSGYGGYAGDSGSGSVSVSHPASLFMRVGCVNFDGVAGTCSNTGHFVERLDLTLHDDDPPTVTGSMTGELLDGAWKTAASGQVSVTAGDVGAGVYRAFLRDGPTTYHATIDAANARCQDAYTANANAYDFAASALSLVPCATASRQYAPTFDLTALGDGTHPGVALGIEDAGGNERTILSNRTLRINAPGGTLPDPGTTGPGGCVYAADGQSCVGGGGGGGGTGGAGTVRAVEAPVVDAPSPPADRQPPPAAPAGPPARPCNGDRCSSTARIALEAAANGAQTVTVRYGARARIVGRVLMPDGDPIAGAMVDVVAASDAREARAAVRGTLRTDADGGFSYEAPAGLSGRVALSYRAHVDDAQEAARYEVRVRVIAGVRLRVNRHRTRNRERVRFRGRILGSPPGWRKVVELQAYSAGRWVTFATTRSRGGRFSYAYRFQRTFTTQTYGFRAVVRNETGWPYLTGSSNRVYVEVLGS